MKTNKVLLIYADKGDPVLPQGVLYVASYLSDFGFDPVILDTRVEQPTLKHFENCLAVGISSMTGHQIGESLKICSLIRSVSPETPIIWGGIHPSITPEQTAAHPMVDVVIRGEGEKTMGEVLQRIRDGSRDFSGICSVSYKTSSGAVVSNPDADILDLDTLPPLKYELLKLDGYSKTTDYFPYLSSRGCPFKCTFCFNRGMNAVWRHRSVENVINDLKIVNDSLGLDKSVHFLDDNLLTDPSFARNLFEAKLRQNLRFEWNASSTIKGFLKYSHEDLALFRKSGLQYIRFGAESGSPKIIKQIRKNFTHEDAFQVVERCKQHEFRAVFNFMVGFPGETAEDRKMTFDFIDRLRMRFKEYFSVKTIWRLVLFPGTDDFARAVEEGYKPPDSLEKWSGYGYTHMPCPPWLGQKEFDELEIINHLTRGDFLNKPRFSWEEYKKKGLPYLWEISSQIRWKYRFFKFPWEWKYRSRYIQRKNGQGSI